MHARLVFVLMGLLAAPVWAGIAAPDAVFERRSEVTARALLRRSDRVVIAGFRVAFNLAGAAAAGRRVTLTGLDGADFQRITEEAYADFAAQLASEGVAVIGVAAMRATAGYRMLDFTPCSAERPHFPGPGAEAGMAVFTPVALPLFLGHFDGDGLGGDAGDLDNWRALNRLSVETRAVVLVPTLVVDFLPAEAAGAGAEMSPRIALAPRLTGVALFHGKLRLAGDLGRLRLGEPLVVPGSFGSVRAMAASGRVVAARPADYQRLSLDAVRRFNRTAGAFIAAK